MTVEASWSWYMKREIYIQHMLLVKFIYGGRAVFIMKMKVLFLSSLAGVTCMHHEKYMLVLAKFLDGETSL